MISRHIPRQLGVLALVALLTACGAGANVTSNPSTSAPASNPPSTTPPATNPPATNPPATNPPPSSGGTTSSIAMTQSAYSLTQTAGAATVTVARTNGTKGVASVQYSTQDGTGVAGAVYTATSGTLDWPDGDSAPKTIFIPINKATPITGTKDFTVALSNAAGSAVLGAPSTATVSVTGNPVQMPGSTGTLALSTTTYGATQSAGMVIITANRASGSSGAVSAAYATSNGTATAGTDYTATSGTLTWAAGDTAAKTFTVPISAAALFAGSRTFTVTLSGATGGASLGSPNTATVTITGGTIAACAQSSNSWTNISSGSHIYDYKQYGNYVVSVDNWGNLPGQFTWANDAGCWGITASPLNTDIGIIRSYPHVTRGWAQSGSMYDLSTPGTFDWTTKVGMGIPVTALTKVKMHWAFDAPTATGSRWDALADVYFHQSANPQPGEFPPAVDLMIIQSLADQVVNNSTFFGLSASMAHATTVTLGGNKYLIMVDASGFESFHQPGGHVIAVFNLPTSLTSNNADPLWGVHDAVTDVAAVIKYLMQSNPVDDAGLPLKSSSGAPVTSPLIASNLYLTAINAGWEVDVGALFTNSAFCVAMQGEADCP